MIPASTNQLLTANTGYRISRSLRFRSSATAYLSRTIGTPTGSTTWTWSAWVKRGSITSSAYQYLFSYDGANSRGVALASSTDTNPDAIYVYNGTSQIYGTTPVRLRDASAWYHITVSCSSGTASVYLNGNSTAILSASSMPAMSNGMAMNIARLSNGGSAYFDGYLAEVNFIDGSALLPTAFGAFDTNGVWQPAKYTGSYGTNGFYLPFSLNSTTAYSASFNGSTQYLAATAPSSFGTNALTVECFAYISAYPGAASLGMLVDTRSTDTNGTVIYINSSGNLYFGSGSNYNISSGKTLAVGVWYHLALTRTGGTTTIWINGVSAGTTADSSSLASTQIRIANNYTNGYPFNGYLSNVRIVNGTAVYTSAFIPPTNNLTAITNTQLLTLQSSTIVDNSSNALTITNNGSVTITSGSTPFAAPTVSSDSSGNANNWATNNINVTSSGATYDSMIDSPTNYADGGNGRGNYCVISPIDFASGSATLSNANLTWTASTSLVGNRGTLGVTSGKWYWEAVGTNTKNGTVGGRFAFTGSDTVTIENDKFGMVWHPTTGIIRIVNGAWTTVDATQYIDGDVLALGLDLDSNISYWYKNGTLILTFNFSSYSTVGTRIFHPYTFNGSSGTPSWAFNFGQRPFTYSNYGTDRPAATFLALNTQNLPTPTIAAGNKYFDIVTRGGTGGVYTKTGLGFQPDFAWTKLRNTAYNHYLQDAVRGVAKQLSSDTTAAEQSITNAYTAFNADGYTLGSSTAVNDALYTYVDWLWKAGGTGVSNTSGSITSTVSANTSAGFSVVTYTGNQTAGATVGHGLGVAPSMIIVKCRGAATSWPVYHSAIGATNWLLLNSTQAQTTSSQEWNNTAPTSTVFSLGTSVSNSNQSSTYVAYCFAPVAGYSSAFSYTGNGSADGPMVYLNFRPRWILTKRTDTTGNWWIFDTSRDPYNVEAARLSPNLSNAEATSAVSFDVLSNGFKVRGTDVDWNASGGSYIGYAIAETPFKFSRSR